MPLSFSRYLFISILALASFYVKAQLTANYTSSAPTNNCTPFIVNFVDISTGAPPPNSWKWDFGDGDILGFGTGAVPGGTHGGRTSGTFAAPAHNYVNPGHYTVKLIVDNGSLKDSLSKVKYVKVGPVADFTASPLGDCEFLKTNFTDISTGGVTGWYWDFGNGTSSTLQNITNKFFIPPLGVTDTFYDVTLRVNNGCPDTSYLTKRVYIYSKPTWDFGYAPAVGCQPLTVNFTDLSIPGSSGPVNSWLWLFGDGGFSKQKNPVYSYVNSGKFTVELIIKDTNTTKCFVYDKKDTIIEVLPRVQTGFTANPRTSCKPPLTVNFTDTSVGSVYWEWDFGDGSPRSFVPAPNHTYVTSGSYPVTLITRHPSGCYDTLIKNNYISIPTALQVGFSASNFGSCPPDNVLFTDTSTGGPINWKWKFGDGDSAISQNPSHIYSLPGSYNVQLIVTNAIGCKDTSTKMAYIVVPDTVIADFSISQNCNNPDSIKLTDASTNANDWQWDFGDGIGTSTLQNPSYIYAASGTYNIKLITRDLIGGCVDSITKKVTIKNLNANFGATPLVGCMPLNVTFSDSSTDALTYAWNFGDGAGTQSTAKNPMHTYTSTGMFTVKLIVTDTNGCVDSLVRTNYIDVQGLLDADFSFQQFCDDLDSVQFTNSSINATSVKWYFGDGDSSILNNPSHLYTSTGTFTVTLVAMNTGCGQDIETRDVIITNLTANFSASPVLGCAPESVVFSDSSVDAFLYDWSFGDGNASGDSTPTNIYATSGVFSVKLTIEDVNGCIDSFIRNNYITIDDPVTASFMTQQFCNDPDSVYFTNTSVNAASIKWFFGDGDSSTTSNPGHVYAMPGPYQVKLIAQNPGCGTDTAFQTVNITNLIVGFRGNPLSGCVPLDVQFTDTSSDAVIWRWYFGDGGQSSAQNPPLHAYNSPGAFDVKLVVTDINGCKDSVTKTGYVNAAGLLNADFNYSVPCANPTSVTFTSTSINADSIFWFFGDGNTDFTQDTNPTHVYASKNNYVVRLVAKNAGCGTDTSTQTIYADSAIANFGATPLMGCEGITIDFFDSTANAVSWQWDFGDFGTSTAQNPSHQYTLAGNYTVSLAITDTNGCVDTLIKNNYITITNSVTADFTFNQFCNDLDSVAFTNTSVNATTYKWLFGDGDTSILTNPTHVYASPGNYNVILIATSSNCVDVTNKLVRITALNSAFNANPTSVCQSGTINFTETATYETAYKWYFGNGDSSTAANPSKFYSAPGTYNVSLIVTDVNGCKDTSMTPVNVSDTVDANFTFTNFCIDWDSVRFTNASSANADSFLWNFGDPGSGINNTDTATNPYHIFSSPGTYNVVLISKNESCLDTIIKSVKVIQPDAGFFATPQAGCHPLNVIFTDTSAAAQSWQWTFGNGNNSTAQNPSSTYLLPGSYNVKLVVTDSNGCLDSITYNNYITVYDSVIADFIADTLTSCSVPFSVQFTDNSTNANSWQWNFGDGAGVQSTAQNPTHIYNTPGTYTVTLIAFSSNGCMDTFVRSNYIQIVTPQASFSGTPLSGCDPLSVNFTDLSTAGPGIKSWKWYFGTGDSSSMQNPNYVYTTQGLFSVTLQITDSTNCTSALTIPNYVQVGQRPNANFGWSDTLSCAVNAIQFFDSTDTATTWQWSFGDGGTSGLQNPNHQYNDTGYFNVILIAQLNGCADTFIVDSAVYILGPVARFTDTMNCINADSVFFADNSIPGHYWTWKFGDGTIIDSVNRGDTFHIYSGSGDYIAWLIVSDTVTGCIDSTSRNLIVRNATANFGAAPLGGCVPVAVTFSDSSRDAITWQWSFGDGATSAIPNPNHTYAIADSMYTVKLVVTDTNGCMDSLIKSNYIDVQDTLVAAMSVQRFCGVNYDSIKFTDASTSLSPYSLLWRFGDGNTSTATNPSHIYAATGDYTVTLVISNSYCSDSITSLIRIRNVQANFGMSPLAGCVVHSVSFSDSSTDATARRWIFGDGDQIGFGSGAIPPGSNGGRTSGTYLNPTHLYDNPDTVYVTLIARDVNGCTDTLISADSIRIRDSVHVDFSHANYCGIQFDSVTFNNTSTGYDSIFWYFGDGTSDSSQNNSPYHLYGSTGNYPVKLIGKNEFCSDTIIDTVKVTFPVAHFGANPIIGCRPLTVTFSDSSTDAVIWQWKYGNGNSAVNFGTHNYTYTGIGIFSVTLNVIDLNGCGDSTVFDSITVLDAIDAQFSVQQFCGDLVYDSVKFTDNTIYDSTVIDDAYTVLWKFGDGNTSTLRNPSHVYASKGTYVVKLFSSNGYCTDSLARTVRITNPEAKINANPTLGCVPLTVAFKGDSSVDAVGWRWNFGTGTGTQSTAQNPNHTYTKADSFYNVRLIVNDIRNCRDTLLIDSLIHVVDTLDAQFSYTQFCGDAIYDSVKFTDNSISKTNYIYHWNFGDGDTSILASPSHKYAGTGNYTVTLTITNGSCSDMISRLVQIRNPQAKFGTSPLLGCVPLPVTFSDSSIDAVGWSWNFGDGFTSTSQNPNHTYTGADSFYTIRLIVNDIFNCKDTLEKINLVHVLDTLNANFYYSNFCDASFDSVKFFDSTQTQTAYTSLWDFGKLTVNTDTSSNRNPSYSYDTTGLFYVKLKVSNQVCADSVIKTLTIVDLQTDFDVNMDTGCVPHIVRFSDSSCYAIDWNWKFGDGDSTSKVVWLKAESIAAADGSTLATWPDISGNGINATQASAGQRPTFYNNNLQKHNCHPMVSFDGSNGNMLMADNALINTGGPYTEKTITVGFRTGSNVTTRQVIYEQGGTTRGINIYIQNNLIYVSAWNYPNDGPNSPWTFKNVNTGIVANTIYYVSLILDQPKGELRGYLNGKLFGTATGVGTLYAHSSDIGIGRRTQDAYFHTGGQTGNGNVFSGDIFEIIMQNVAADRPQHIYDAIGSYDVTLNVRDMNCCEKTITKAGFIKVLDTLVAKFGYTHFCNSLFDSVTFHDSTQSLSPYTHHWDFGDGDTSILANPNHVYAATGDYIVTLTVTNGFCSDIYIDTVKIRDPQANFGGLPLGGCAPLNVVFKDSSQDAIAWNWNFGDGNTSTAQDTSHVYMAANIYSVRLIVTDLNACKDTLTRSSYITATDPIPDFTVNDQFACRPHTAIFNDLSTDAFASINKWNWNFGDGNTDTIQNPSHIYTSNGTYTVRLIVTDTVGCKDTIIKTNYIGVTYPTAAFTADSVVCENELAMFINSSSGAGLSYQWNFGDGNISTATNPSHLYIIDSIYTVSLIATDSNGCSDTMIKTNFIETIIPKVDFFATPTTYNCTPAPIFFDASSSSDDIIEWKWFMGDGSVKNFLPAPFAAHVYTYADTFDIIAIGKSSKYGKSCGFDTLTKLHYIRVDIPGGSFNVTPDSGCLPLGAIFRTNTVNTIQYSWDFGDGDGITLVSPIDTAFHVYTTEGTFYPRVELSDGLGCFKFATGNDSIRTIAPLPAVILATDSIICNDENLMLMADTVDIYYEWTPITDAIPQMIFGRIVTVAPDTNTTYRLVTTDDLGCNDTALINITVNPIPVLNVGTDTTLCLGDSIQITAGVTNDSLMSFLWTPSLGLSCDTCLNTIAQPDVGTNVYNVLVTDTGTLCDDQNIVTIIVNAPEPTAASPDQFICLGETAEIEASGGTIYNWTPADFLDDPNVENPSSTPDEANTTITYTVDIIDVNGCIAESQQVSVTTYPVPKVDAGEDITIEKYSSRQLQAIADLSVSYSWSPEDDMNDPHSASPTVRPLDTTTFIVTVTTPEGCSSDDTIRINVVYIYAQVATAFTPNGDGVNDFLPVESRDVSEIDFKVFDRYGKLLFQTTDIHSSGWDGTNLKGRPVDLDTYMYYLRSVDVLGREKIKTGNITLIR